MSKKRNPLPLRPPGGHLYPPNFGDEDWIVPYAGDNAVIRHGHESADDHSLCGPQVFCCARSPQLYLQSFPNGAESQASWEITNAAHIDEWLKSGVNVIYFIFCDPGNPDGLLGTGLPAEDARKVLYKQVRIEDLAPYASRIR